jgi:type I restriction enzyme M protein
MDLDTKLNIVCPIRGRLNVTKKSKDGLSPTEEYYRVEALKHFIRAGYPKENFFIEPIIKRFGNSGRNSFRSDFAVLDTLPANINTSSPDALLEHTVLLCEVKRDNAKAEYVKSTQVKPMLDFATNELCVGIYWDNIEQRIFWHEKVKGKRITKEGPLSFLPSFGEPIQSKPITFANTVPSDSLIDIFSRIEDILHQASFDHEKRYEIILQLLLTKIFDEHAYETRPNEPLGVQDYSAIGINSELAFNKFAKIVERAISYYEKHLPNKVSKSLYIPHETLADILKIIAPIRIIHSKRDVIQTFYMKFAKDLYKWDLAQYFTPTTVTDFIVDVLNPQFGEHVCDPACGSADFLIAAFRIGRKYNPGYADSVWGIDNSANAVQISVLNMLLNGDGKTNIKKDDSLLNVNKYQDKYDILVCNPPFGTKIIEKRTEVLRNFELGREMHIKDGNLIVSDNAVMVQESGLLFVEVCVKQVKPGGRIGIILPNGYLGNRSPRYRMFREWLFRRSRVVGIVSFPRFTFKTSGADVSASVIFLEKRKDALVKLPKDDYSVFIEMIEKVGWDAGNKKAAPVYVRDNEHGTILISEDGIPVIDSDFPEALTRIFNSDSCANFHWLADNRLQDSKVDSWAIPVSEILKDPDLTLDPKRYCQKVITLRKKLHTKGHFTLGSIVDFLPEKKTYDGKAIKISNSKLYNYVEIQDIGYGEYYVTELRGWQLPSRARHFAEEGDIYFGSIWGSVAKWCYIGKNQDNIVITNGCHRCRIKKEHEEHLLDLICYMNSEGWQTQMRSFARGSDGLAEISVEDASKIFVPIITDSSLREELESFITNLKEGRVTLNRTIEQLTNSKRWKLYEPPKRPSHIVLV